MIEYKVGDKFGNWEYIGGVKKKGKYKYLLCKCKCGKESYVDIQSLKRGKSKQCKECGYKVTQYKNIKHGDWGIRFYKIRRDMINRCTNKNSTGYKNYGGRGIKVCNYRKEYKNFKNDMYELYLKHSNEYGEKNTTIERIDIDKGYNKYNCKWATKQEQSNNKKNSHFVYIKGEKYTVAQIAKKYNIPYYIALKESNNGTIDKYLLNIT